MNTADCKGKHDPTPTGPSAVGSLTAMASEAPRWRILDAIGGVLTVLLTLAAGQVSAAEPELQSHESIIEAAEEAVGNAGLQGATHVRIEAGPLDRRLRLKRCATPLAARAADGAKARGRTTVSVSCSGPVAWKLHVPVRTVRYGPVLVAAESMARGSVIAADQLIVEERELDRLAHGHLSDPAAAAGLQLKRPLSAGQVLTPGMVESLPMVERGQRVTLAARRGGFEVRMRGLALTDGAAGQRIRVRNLSSSRDVEGVVRSAQVVEVLLR